MDTSATLRRSFRLAGLLPSTSPPPLGERTRQSRRTDTHFDSHTDITMTHTSEIPEIPTSPPPMWKVAPSSTYGTPELPNHAVAGESHDALS